MTDIVERLRNEDFDFDLAQRELMASEKIGRAHV